MQKLLYYGPRIILEYSVFFLIGVLVYLHYWLELQAIAGTDLG